MARFIRVPFIKGETKINLDNIRFVTLQDKKVFIGYIDSDEIGTFEEGVHIKNAREFYNYFPC